MILREPANAIDPRMRTCWTLQALIGTAVLAALVVAGTTIAAVLDATTAAWLLGVIGGLAVVVVGVSSVVAVRLGYRHFRYEVTEHGLYVARGRLWRRQQIVPHARLQTVDTTAGPLLRAFGLVAVEVSTASAAGGTSIPGLRRGVADDLVTELARRAELEEGT
ncbi:MAG: PH domain-containing protein [Gaiellaceae bacterium]